MPAEWELHRATWLVWPHNRDDWEMKSSSVEWVYVEIVRHLVDGERVCILCQDLTVKRRVSRRLGLAGVDLGRVDLYRITTNRSWIRDSGPIFVTKRSRPGVKDVAITDWRFNGWARYRAWQRDNLIPRRIARRLGLRRFEVTVASTKRPRQVVLEGGSIDVNGRGLLLTTEECLLSERQARNPGLTKLDMERIFSDYLGIQQVLWLDEGISGDDTHGHVDDVARFVSATTVAAATELDPRDENYSRLKENLARLAKAKDKRGRPLRTIKIPMPHALEFSGRRLPASYLNFYIGNRTVLVPTFNDPRDRLALAKLAEVFPTRRVVGIHSIDLVLGLGAIHCLTQQEPAAAS